MTTVNEATARTDVAKRENATITQMITNAERDFAQVLPSHVKPELFTRLAVGCLRRDAELARRASANPASLMQALLEAARLGLEPGTKEFYLTPRGGKQPGVLGIVGYQGEIELIYRAGAVSSVKAELVRANDTFGFDPSEATPTHTVDWFGDRGEVRGAYAYAVMRDGGSISKVVMVGPREIERAMSASPTANSAHSPWKTDFGAMVLKTAIHQLAKWVPTSAEYRREQLRAATQVAAERPTPAHNTHRTPIQDPGSPAGVDTETGEIVDGEIVDDPEPESVEAITKAQSKGLHAALRNLGVGDRDQGLAMIGDILDRKIETTSGLTKDEASAVISTLTQMVADQNVPDQTA